MDHRSFNILSLCAGADADYADKAASLAAHYFTTNAARIEGYDPVQEAQNLEIHSSAKAKGFDPGQA